MYEIVRDLGAGLNAFAKISGASTRRAVVSLQFATEVLGIVADIQKGRTVW
jgi:hypothetical protein